MNDEREIRIAPATDSDVAAIEAMLADSGLAHDGVGDHWKTFVVAWDGDRRVGCGGAEAFQFAALIRSINVIPEYRSQGLGRRIVRQLLDRLASRGLREFYLLTSNAEPWFRKRGFKTVDRDEVHPQLLASLEQQDTPEAVCMRLVMLG